MPNSPLGAAAIASYGEYAQAWLRQQQALTPAFVCVLGFTETALIPGISAAGATPESRRYTALADAEFLINGPNPHPVYALPPLTAGASPVLITRALTQACGWPIYLFNAGLPAVPSVPMVDLGGKPSRCLTTGQAMSLNQVQSLWAQGLAWGKSLGESHGYLIISECVVGGTTTALAVLEGLGFPARHRIGSSHVQSNQSQKWQIVQAGFEHLPSNYSPWDLLVAVGDGMQVVAAGLLVSASQRCGVMLAGGSQMVAVYALAQALAADQNLAWEPSRVVIGTTRWIVEDFSADVRGLASEVGVSLLATQLNLGQSQFTALQAYERGFVKEGVGAGGTAIAASLNHHWTTEQIAQAVESIAEDYLASRIPSIP